MLDLSARYDLERLYTLNEAQWELIAPYFPKAPGQKGFQQEIANREVFEAVLWRTRTGCPWRDIPPCFGFWHTIYTRWSRWGQAGVPQRAMSALHEAQLAQGDFDLRLVLLDSTIVRAHQHAAGAPKKRASRRLGAHAGA